MTFRQVCNVNNNQIIVVLPAAFKDKKQVIVVVDDQIDSKRQKLEMLKQATNDPLFLLDIEEVHKDFDSIDNETL